MADQIVRGMTKDGYVKVREDYIHSFIDEHERGVEPEEGE